MTKVYDQFDSATAGIQAVALLRDGKAVGRVVIKFGRAATAYVHLTGSQMASGRATGGGYDKATAAVRAAIEMLDASIADPVRAALITGLKEEERRAPDGPNWTSIIDKAGFTVANVI